MGVSPLLRNGASRYIARSSKESCDGHHKTDDLQGFCESVSVSSRSADSADLITRPGKPAGVLIGFESPDDWLDDRLENDPRFLRRIEQARSSLHAGRGIRLEDIEAE
jgi:hypothetical protein